MTNLKLQKKLASKALKAGKGRVKLDSGMAEELKEAITKLDIKDLAKEGAIEVLPVKAVSRHRARKRHLQKKKGRQRGHGKRKGKATARTPKKEVWMNKIRGMRKELKVFKEGGALDKETYRTLYRKAKGGFFRSKRHMRTYVDQHGLLKTVKEDKE